jgi:hypothetical protein
MKQIDEYGRPSRSPATVMEEFDEPYAIAWQRFRQRDHDRRNHHVPDHSPATACCGEARIENRPQRRGRRYGQEAAFIVRDIRA